MASPLPLPRHGFSAEATKDGKVRLRAPGFPSPLDMALARALALGRSLVRAAQRAARDG